MARYAAIIGLGMAVPERVLTNADLERMVDTSDDWIRTRTGIIERHIVGPGEATSDLATKAGRMALERAKVSPDEIDLVILATCTPDRLLPATACTVQEQLGIPRAGAFDLAAACSGFLYGLSVASAMVQSGMHKTVLLVAADLFSHILNWQDRNTCILFGDGAGAVVLRASSEPVGVLTSVLGSWGKGENLMMREAGGTKLPLTAQLIDEQRNCFVMHGREVFKHAVRGMCESAEQAIAAAGLTKEDIHMVIPHQANVRIIESIAKRLDLPMERVFVNIERYGNTSAASVPIALYEAAERGLFTPGDHLLLTAFGGGVSWASLVVRWGIGNAQ